MSLGCPKALVDSERILTQLRAEGYAVAPSYEDADLVVVNTCGFIDAAVAESLDAIGEALDENGKVIVTGCLGARERGDFVRAAHPKVLAVTGPHATHEVMSAVHAHLPRPHDPFVDLVPPQGIRLTPSHYAYLKISEGCNHRCTFCIIPSLRGDLASRPFGEVLGEAERLLRAGVRELLVVSQDTSAYGVDVRYRTGFWQGRPVKTNVQALARELDALAKSHDAWVRLHYVYPYPHVDDIVPLMASSAHARGLLPYLDIPFQHASPRILRAMKRPAAPEKVLDRIAQWRKARPGMVLRSTFIVGFPGETQAEFDELLAFLREARLDRVGCFAYSTVAGAAANALSDPVPEEIGQARRARFMAVQAEISAMRLRARIGTTIDVLVDRIDDGIAVARGPGDAPEIDGVVRIDDSRGLTAGAFVRVRITASDAHDLVGVPVSAESAATAPAGARLRGPARDRQGSSRTPG